MNGLIGAWRNNWIHPCNKWFLRKTEKPREWDFDCELEKIFEEMRPDTDITI